MHGKAVVVGLGETEYYKHGQSPITEFQLAVQSIQRAAEDAGLPTSELDGLISYMDNRNSPLRLAAALGMNELSWSNTPWAGGGNNSAAAVQLADAAVSGGYANYVVVFRALAQGEFYRLGSSAGKYATSRGTTWGYPYGLISPAQECAIHTKRWMHDNNVSQEVLANITLACYHNAQLNPRAVRYGRPLTREAYHESRMIVEPFHLYDCCQENDGATALIVTTPERAKDLKQTAVSIVATAQGLGPEIGAYSYQKDWFPGTYLKNVGDIIWERSDAKPEDIDVVQMYENFTGPVAMALVDMGFCTVDQLEEFTGNGNLEGPDAKMPFNTSGGNIAEAYIHGLEMVNEAVRQVRGESTCQVKDVELSLAVGGPGYSPGSAILFGAE